ncbi:MAG TPA: sugar phosphate isomerase/epimerase [Planctomycetaceae bacterium]|nr:sugar phosphate isomerase/epimerase [Planctomycetaceae bacterium]
MLSLGGRPSRAGRRADRKIRIALQLYSVRHACQKDLAGVLKAVAGMGYEGVEFAGYYDRSAEELRQLLDQNGLVCCGTHLRLAALAEDALEETIQFNRTLGNKYLIVSWMPPSYRKSVQSVREVAERFNRLAGKLKPLGMRVGYHAHGGDFEKVEGRTAWDIFFESTVQDVVMQLDVGNCLEGGGDPIATLKRFPGRSATIHLKEYGGPPEAVLGEGEVDWKQVLSICRTTGGTEWYIVEHERGVGDPLDNVRRCLENLKKLV